MTDDSDLFHARVYDPVKAREYYLRTRKLKGRRKGRAVIDQPSTGRRQSNVVLVDRSKKRSSKAERRRAELKAQKEALQKRLERLREVLDQLVKDAKRRSGVKTPAKKGTSGSKSKSGSSTSRKSSSSGRERKLTQREKAVKAKKAKEQYEKDHPNTLSDDIEILQEQIKDIKAQIKKALEQSKKRQGRATIGDEKTRKHRKVVEMEDDNELPNSRATDRNGR